MTLPQFLEITADCVEGVEINELTATTVFRDLKHWDSLAALTLIDSVEEASGVLLRKADFDRSTRLGELHACVENGK